MVTFLTRRIWRLFSNSPQVFYKFHIITLFSQNFGKYFIASVRGRILFLLFKMCSTWCFSENPISFPNKKPSLKRHGCLATQYFFYYYVHNRSTPLQAKIYLEIALVLVIKYWVSSSQIKDLDLSKNMGGKNIVSSAVLWDQDSENFHGLRLSTYVLKSFNNCFKLLQEFSIWKTSILEEVSRHV